MSFLRLLRMKVGTQKAFRSSLQLTHYLVKVERQKVIFLTNDIWGLSKSIYSCFHVGFSNLNYFTLQGEKGIRTWTPQGTKMYCPRWLWHPFLFMFATTLLLFRHFCIVCHICRVTITIMRAVWMRYAKATNKLFEVLVTHGSEEVKYVIQEAVHTLELYTYKYY